MSDERKHARYSPSSSGRWLACPGSVALSEQVPPRPAGPAAEEGTRKHGLAEAVLRGTLDETELVASDWHDIEPYVEYCRSLSKPAGKWWVEPPLPLWYEPGQSGHADYAALHSETNILHVVDYKSGHTPVSAKSSQLKIYGICAMDALIKDKARPTLVMLTIVQPPINRMPQTHVTTPHELEQFRKTVDLAVAAGEAANPERVPGQEQCRWCPARQVCPERGSKGLSLIQSFIDQPKEDPFLGLTSEQRELIMNNADFVRSVLDDLEQYALANVEEFPEFEVRPKRKNKVWTNLERVLDLARTLGVEPFAEPKVKSPSQMLKSVEQPRQRRLFEPFIDQPEGEPALKRRSK